MLTVEFSSRCKCSKISRRELRSNSRFRLMPKMSKWVIYNQSYNFHRKHDDNHLGNEGSHLQTHVFFHPTVGWSWSGSLRLEFTVCSSYFQGVNWVNCCFNYGKKHHSESSSSPFLICSASSRRVASQKWTHFTSFYLLHSFTPFRHAIEFPGLHVELASRC